MSSPLSLSLLIHNMSFSMSNLYFRHRREQNDGLSWSTGDQVEVGNLTTSRTVTGFTTGDRCTPMTRELYTDEEDSSTKNSK